MQTNPSTPAPSSWITHYADLFTPNSHVLDLACGSGRHARLFIKHNHCVTVVDRNLDGVADLAGNSHATLIEADLENAPWSLAGRQYDAIVVCNYLHRPLMPCIIESVAPGGLLLYDTFAVGNEQFGRPRNPDFLLRPNELLDLLPVDFIVRGYQHGRVDTPKPAVRQRLCAVRAPAS